MPEPTNDVFRYLPVSQRTVQWGLYLTGCGHLMLPGQSEHPPRGHPTLYWFDWEAGRTLPDYQAIYLVNGSGVFESSETGRRKISAGEVMLLFPGIWHRYRPLDRQSWETYWIGFNGSLVNTWQANRLLHPAAPVMKLGKQPELISAYCRLIDRTIADTSVNPHLLSAGVMNVMSLILAPSGPQTPQPFSQSFDRPIRDRLVAEAVRLIWTTGQHAMSVTELVSRFPTTRRSLERRFQRTLGHTILDEIVRCRIERARQLLTETDLPLKAVAFAAGFTAAERMSKVFHRTQGVSPTQYRRQHRQSRPAE